VLFALVSVAMFVSILVTFAGNPHYYQGNIIQFDVVACDKFQPNIQILKEQIETLQDAIIREDVVNKRIALNLQQKKLESKKRLLETAYQKKCQ
jgi:hypothetical protein